jgi:hypothetical protein
MAIDITERPERRTEQNLVSNLNLIFLFLVPLPRQLDSYFLSWNSLHSLYDPVLQVSRAYPPSTLGQTSTQPKAMG